MTSSTTLSPTEFQKFLQFIAAAGGGQAPPHQIQVKVELPLPDLLVTMHGYWKSKVYELHRSWKEVTTEVDINDLDKRDIDAESEYHGQKMPIFKLGDRVRVVGGDVRMFKILHKKVGIWKEKLKQLIGKEAIVMNLSSHFAVGIALIENGNLFQVNGYALEKIDNYSEQGIWANETEFKRNDEVVIGVDDSVLAHLQINSRKTPIRVAAQLRGYIGRVMCCYEEEVVVTFDEIKHELFNPSALIPYDDGKGKKLNKLPLKDDLRIGQKVRIISDGDKVMALQRGHGEWNYRMTKFVGKEGVVIDNNENADVIVKFSPFESYRMNREALEYRTKKIRARTKSGSTSFGKKPFAIGDILQLNVSPFDLASNFQLLRIPVTFLSVISGHMTFVGYQNDTKVVVDIGNGRELQIDIHHLQKIENAVEVLKLKKADKAIRVGSKVQLFTGPKCYVKEILKNFKPGFEKALNHLGTIVGYDKSGNVIIQYDDNKLYSVPDEHICSPREFWNSRPEEAPRFINWDKQVVYVTSPSSVSPFEAKVLNIVAELLEKLNGSTGGCDCGDWMAETRGAAAGTDMRTVAVSFRTFPENFEAFEKQLKDKLLAKGYQLEKEDRNIFVVSCASSSFKMIFCEEGSKHSKDGDYKQVSENTGKVEDKKPPASILERSVSINDVISEGRVAGNAAAPIVGGTMNVTVPQGVSQIVLQLGRDGVEQHATPVAHPPSNVYTNIVMQGGSHIFNVNSQVQENEFTINDSSVRLAQDQR